MIQSQSFEGDRHRSYLITPWIASASNLAFLQVWQSKPASWAVISEKGLASWASGYRLWALSYMAGPRDSHFLINRLRQSWWRVTEDSFCREILCNSYEKCLVQERNEAAEGCAWRKFSAVRAAGGGAQAEASKVPDFRRCDWASGQPWVTGHSHSRGGDCSLWRHVPTGSSDEYRPAHMWEET